jgi:hypothetical protein
MKNELANQRRVSPFSFFVNMNILQYVLMNTSLFTARSLNGVS